MKTRGGVKYQSLQTIRRIGTLPAVGSLFINGISNRYEEGPPPLLLQILSKKQVQKFLAYMEQLNIKTNQYWPCLAALCLGYSCMLCTLGLSLCLPRLCVSQSEQVLHREVRKINDDILRPKRLEMRLEKSCCSSRLIIEEIEFDQFQNQAFDF